jgi:hypothetical protein
MSYVVNLLINKKEEYQTLLNILSRQLEDGNVFRSQFEVDGACEAKSRYEVIIRDIEEKLTLINCNAQ